MGNFTGRYPLGHYKSLIPPKVDPPPASVAPPEPAKQVVPAASGEVSYSQSAYGSAIPLVFGADKVPGNVIWASPVLTKVAETAGAIAYYRVVDFAVAVAEGPINGVLRIWMGDRLIYSNSVDVDGSNDVQARADGSISGYLVDVTDPTGNLRNAIGSIKQTKISVFNGDENQTPHSIMTQTEGYTDTPGYRGTAYVMFENFVIENTQIPNLQFEISANTVSGVPRLTAETPSTLTGEQSDTLCFDPYRRRIYQNSEHVTSGEGLLAYNADNMQLLSETEYANAFLSGVFEDWATLIPLRSGNLALFSGLVNNGYLQIVNPYANAVVATMGPNDAGSAFQFNANGFPGSMQDMCSFRLINENGVPVDVIAGVSNLGDDMGFCSYDGEATPVMEYFTGGSHFTKDRRRICYDNIPYEWARKNQFTFVDNAADPQPWRRAFGDFIYVIEGDDPEDTNFTLHRFVIEIEPGNGTWTVYDVNMVDISVAEFDGLGRNHNIRHIMADENDHTLLMWVDGTDNDWLCKYDPVSEVFRWKTKISGFTTSAMFAKPANIKDCPIYAFIDNAGSLITVDLITGWKTTVYDSIVTDASLGGNVGGARQYWDGFEQCLYYYVAGNFMTKVYVGRQTRQPTSLQVIVRTLLNRVGMTDAELNVDDFSSTNVRGFSITKVASIRSVLQELRRGFVFEVVESNGRLKYVSRGSSSVATVSYKYMADGGEPGGYLPTESVIDISRLRKVNLTYKDIAREYNSNVQSVYLPSIAELGFDSDAAIQVSLPIAMNADEARYLADKLLYSKRVGEIKYNIDVPFRHSNLDPGDVITLDTDSSGSATELVRITKMSVAPNYRVGIEAVREDPDIYNIDPALAGQIGRFNEMVFPTLPSILEVFVLPIPYRYRDEAVGTGEQAIGEVFPIANFFYTLLNLDGTGTTYPYDVIPFAPDLFASTSSINAPKTFPTWGYATTALSDPVNPFTPDPAATLTVRLVNENADYPLADVTDWDTFISNAYSFPPNMCLVGREIIQFQDVTDNGDGTYTLTGLIRGRNGTDRWKGAHFAGERFMLLSNESGELDDASFGVRVRGITSVAPIVDWGARFDIVSKHPYQEPSRASIDAWEYAPWNVHDVDIVLNGSNEYDITWVRRGRLQGEMPDDGDDSGTVILDEEIEQYAVFVSDADAMDPDDASTYLRKTTVDATTSWTYTSAMQTADGFDYTTDTLYVAIYQVSSWAGEDLSTADVYSLAP